MLNDLLEKFDRIDHHPNDEEGRIIHFEVGDLKMKLVDMLIEYGNALMYSKKIKGVIFSPMRNGVKELDTSKFI